MLLLLLQSVNNRSTVRSHIFLILFVASVHQCRPRPHPHTKQLSAICHLCSMPRDFKTSQKEDTLELLSVQCSVASLYSFVHRRLDGTGLVANSAGSSSIRLLMRPAAKHHHSVWSSYAATTTSPCKLLRLLRSGWSSSPLSVPMSD